MKTKNRYQLIILLLLLPLMAWSQTVRNNELTFQVGGIANPADASFDDFVQAMCRKNDFDPAYLYQHVLQGKHHVTVSGSYHHRFGQHLWGGITGSYASALHHYDHTEITPTWPAIIIPDVKHVAKAHINSHLFFVAPSARYEWHASRKGTVHLYSGAALGVACQRLTYKPERENSGEAYDETHWKLAYQFTPVGIEYAPNAFVAFLELGYGYQGMVNAGVRIAF